MYGCASWTIRTTECQRIDGLEFWCWKRLLRVPWTARRSHQSTLKKYLVEGLRLKVKLQYFVNIIWRPNSLEKTLMLGKIEGKRRRGWQDERDGWHHQLSGRKFEQTPGDGEGQGSLVCCSPRGHRVGRNWVTEQQRNSCLACLVRGGAEDVATPHVNLMLNSSV